MLRQRRWLLAPNEPPNDTHTHISTAFGQHRGIYILRASRGHRDQLRSLRRLFCDDDAGTLYVGSGNPVVGRFGGLRTGIFAAYKHLKSSGSPYVGLARHGVGNKMSSSFVEAFKLKDLVIEILSWDAKQEVPPDYDCRQHEAQVLAAYMERFGEAPPLKRAMPAAKPGHLWEPATEP